MQKSNATTTTSRPATTHQRVSIKQVLASVPASEVSTTEPRKILPFKGMEVLNHQVEALRVLELIFEKSINCDVTFIVEDLEIKAHRAILALQSPVMNEMLLGNHFRESLDSHNTTISLPGKRANPFRIFLRYLYTGHFDLPNLDLDTVIDVLFIANEYQVTRLSSTLGNSLMRVVGFDTVFRIYEAALVLDAKSLLEMCRDFACENAKLVLKSPAWHDLTDKAIIDMISRDAFAAPEIDILMAIAGWYDRNKPCDLRHMLTYVRLELVNLDGLTMLQVAPLYELLISQQIDLRKVGTSNPAATANRQRLVMETENVATPQKGTTILAEGDPVNPLAMISGNYSSATSAADTRHCTYHSGIGSYITVRLGKPCRVGSMLIVLKNNNSLGFTVDISVDNKQWECLADCSINVQQQPLVGPVIVMFAPRRIQYIKLTGQADYDWFFVQHFECPTSTTAEDKERFKKHGQNNMTVLYLKDTQRTIVSQPSPIENKIC